MVKKGCVNEMIEKVRTCPRCEGTSTTPAGSIKHLRKGCRLPNSGSAIPESARATARPSVRVARSFDEDVRKLAMEQGLSLRDAFEGVMGVGTALIRRAGSIGGAMSALRPASASRSPKTAKLLEDLRVATAGPPLIMSDANEAFDMGLESAANIMSGRIDHDAFLENDVATLLEFAMRRKKLPQQVQDILDRYNRKPILKQQ